MKGKQFWEENIIILEIKNDKEFSCIGIYVEASPEYYGIIQWRLERK